MADGVGFEPTRPLRVYGISSAAPSTELGDPSEEAIVPTTPYSPGWSTVAATIERRLTRVLVCDLSLAAQ